MKVVKTGKGGVVVSLTKRETRIIKQALSVVDVWANKEDGPMADELWTAFCRIETDIEYAEAADA